MLRLTREERMDDGLVLRSYRDGVTLVVTAQTRSGFTKVIASHGTVMDPRMQRVESTFVLEPVHNTHTLAEWTIDGQPVNITDTPHAYSAWHAIYGEPTGTIMGIMVRWLARIAVDRYVAA